MTPKTRFPAKHSSIPVFAATALLALFSGSSVYSATTTWSNVGFDFNTDANWSNAVPATGGTAVFLSSASNLTADLSSDVTTGKLAFGSNIDPTASGYDITSTAGKTLTLTSGISFANTSGTNTIDAAVSFGNNATITGTTGGTLVLNGPVAIGGTVSVGNLGKYVVNGAISGSGFLSLAGNVTLNAASTVSGTIGMASTSATLAMTVGNNAAFGTSTLQFKQNGGSITASIPMTGANAIANPWLWSTTSTGSVSLNGTNAIEFSGNMNLAGAVRTVTINNTGGATFSGVISNDAGTGFVVNGPGSLTLTGQNTYTGITALGNNGKLNVSNIGITGAASNLGTSGTINIGNGYSSGVSTYTVTYTGTGETTDKTLLLQNGSSSTQTQTEVLDMSGTGLLKITGNVTTSGAFAGTRALTLQGSTSGSGEIAGNIQAPVGGFLQVIKQGTGTWTLSGSNSYSNATTVAGGTLIFDGNSGGTLNGGSGITVNAAAGAVLQINGNYSIGTLTSGSLTINGGNGTVQGTLSLVNGSANTLTLVNNSATDVFRIGSAFGNQPGALNMDVGATSDEIIVGSGASKVNLSKNQGVAAILNLNGLGTLTPGTQTLIYAPGGVGTTSGTRASFTNGFSIGTTTGNFHGCTVYLGVLGSGLTGLTLITYANDAPTAAYWKGTNGDGVWNSFTSGTANISNFTTDAAGTTNADGLISAASDVTFDTGVGTVSTTLGEDFAINSLTLNSTGVVSIGGANTLTINATTANGNASGNGITVGAGAGNHSISANIVLGNDQTWTVTDSSNTLTVSGRISGAQALTKAGAGKLVLSGSNSYTGQTTVAAGTLAVNGNISASNVVVNSGAILTGSGRTGSVVVSGALQGTLTTGDITGAGKISPGSGSTGGILTASTVDLSSGVGFQFKLTTGTPTYNAGSGNSGNDVLRLTSASPLNGTAVTGNTFDIYIGVSSLSLNEAFRGGIFADTGDISLVLGATYNYFVLGDGQGTHLFNGVNYYSLGEFNTASNASWSIGADVLTGVSANFADGSNPTNGSILEFVAVPEPSTWAMMAGGVGMLLCLRGSRRRQTRK
jgi:autotransporter-associated beta strand protein